MAKKKHPKKNTSPISKKSKSGGGRVLDLFLPRCSQPEEAVWRYLPWWLAAAFILRAAVALSGDFVIHPDEIMQYLEPAHRLVFGNGISYWEFYYGARSWLVPSLVAGILFLCKGLGLDTPFYYIGMVKLFFCALSLFIPLALYILGRRLFSETTGRIALLLGVFWYELIGFAHKPMTEFVATSLLMASTLLALRATALTAPQALFAGALSVLIVAVRFHYAPLIGLVMLVPFLRGDNRCRMLMLSGAAGGLLAVGLFEYATWGGWFYSYRLNFNVNLLLNQGRSGESPPLIFLGWLIAASGGLFLATGAALANYRRYLFILLLLAVILLLHMGSAHREYRFIFVMIPLWLLLFADYLAVGWRQKTGNSTAGRRYIFGGACAALVSLAGIFNVLPLQSWVYTGYSNETGIVRFLRGQDETFAIYRRLAADESVLGVQEIRQPYFNTGGYYYLHRRVPFYSTHTIDYPPSAARHHVSHIIAYPPVTPAGVVQSGNRLFMSTEEGEFYPLPTYISDQSLNQLIFWNTRGEAEPVEGFSLDYTGNDYAIWKADKEQSVKQWKRYTVAPDSEAMYRYIEPILGDKIKPAKHWGIEFN